MSCFEHLGKRNREKVDEACRYRSKKIWIHGGKINSGYNIFVNENIDGRVQGEGRKDLCVIWK